MLNGRRAFPLTDYHYQATSEAPLTAAPSSPSVRTAALAAEVRSFRKLSLAAIASESRWQFALEAAVLAMVVAVSVWALAPTVTLMSQFAYRW